MSYLYISQIEVDFIWAVIHSTSNVFLRCDNDYYLVKCWSKVVDNVEETEIQVVLHLCSARLMHSVAYHINNKFN